MRCVPEGDFAGTVIGLLTDLAGRRRAEDAARRYAARTTWAGTTQALRLGLLSLADGGVMRP